MAIENFFTIQIGQKSGDSAVSGTKAIPAGLSSTGSPGLDFLNLLFGQVDAKIDAKKMVLGDAGEDLKTQISNRDEILKKKFQLHLQKILAANPDIAQQVSTLPLDVQEQIAETLLLNQKAFDDVLKPITSGDGTITDEDIENGTPGLLHALLAAIDEKQKLFLEKNKTVSLGIALDRSDELALKTDGSERPTDIIVKIIRLLKNMTPEQINDIQQKAAALQKKNPGLSKEDAILLVTGFTPAILTPPVKQTQAADAASDKTQQSSLAALALQNPQIQANPQQAAKAKNASALASTGNVAPPSFKSLMASPFNPATPETEESADLPTNEKTSMGKIFITEMTQVKSGSQASVNIAASAAITESLKTGMTPFFDYTKPFYEEFNAHFNGLSINGPANFANLVTQAPHAGAPLPHTQTISAAIVKAAATGEMREITLQLDPAELGRLEVRMAFGKDKSVKATILAEKPETYMMLQRDSHALEKALQDAGLEADGSINFQLADQGYNFDQNQNNRGGGHDRGGTGAGGSEEIEIIESAMNWQVDPQTGHMRYSILA